MKTMAIVTEIELFGGRCTLRSDDEGKWRAIIWCIRRGAFALGGLRYIDALGNLVGWHEFDSLEEAETATAAWALLEETR